MEKIYKQCPKPIRYPNEKFQTKNTQFSLTDDGQRLGYIDARKEIYLKKYKQLIRNTDCYKNY